MAAKLRTAFALVALGIIGRFLPHPPNATPIDALAVEARMRLGAPWAVALPLVAMLVADALIGFYSLPVLAGVYLSFALIGCASALLPARARYADKAAFALGACLLFFLITNGAVWLFSPWYAKSVLGLAACLAAGLPFLVSMLAGDLAFLGLFHAYAYRRSLASRLRSLHRGLSPRLD